MEIIILIVLLFIAAETTYLTVNAQRKNQRVALAPAFVDTSVLIDGRIVSIAESGFISRPLYIPRSVVGELQFLADNGDSDKRMRARHGLDVITQLQALSTVKVHIFNDSVRANDGVDNRLLELAKKHNGALCTIDYNLNKVAVVEGIEVLNVNELAKTLRMAYLPGERTKIELSQKGNDSHQAVGHLSDGTMVVVEHAYKQIGKTVEVEFIRSLQTAAGKMMFAKLTQATEPPVKQKAPMKGKAPVAKVIEKKTQKKQAVSQQATQQSQSVQQPTPSRPQAARTRQPEQQPKAQRKPVQGPSRRRRQTPEDSMVELANRTES